MQEVYKSIGRFAAIRNAVLIEGEPGTGKELVARTIHQYGEFRAFAIEKFMANDVDSLIDELSYSKPNDRECGENRTILIEDIEHLSLANQSRILLLLRDKAETSQNRTKWFFTTSASTRSLLDKGVLRSDFFYLLSSTLIALHHSGREMAILNCWLPISYRGRLKYDQRRMDTPPGLAPTRCSCFVNTRGLVMSQN